MRWAAVLAIVILAGLPLTTAQATLQSASATLSRPLPLDEATIYNGTGQAENAQDCLTGTISVGTGFDFAEGVGTGCAEIIVPISPPGNATRMDVGFTADRRIQGGGGVAPTVVVSMPQQLRLYSGDDTAVVLQVFDEADRGSEARPFRFTLPLEGPGPFALGWYFEDRGPTSELSPVGFGGGESFAATVSDIRVVYPDIPVTAGVAPGGERDDTDRGTRTTWTLVNVTVPEAWMQPATADILVQVAADDLDSVRVAGDPTPLPAVTETSLGLQIHLDDAYLQAHGPGAYSMQFRTEAALPPPPVPAPPPVLSGLFYVAAGVPLIAWTSASYSAARYRREADGIYRRTALVLIVTVAALLVYYLVLTAVSWSLFGPTFLQTLPLGSAPILVYAQYLLLTLTLAAIAVYVARSSMQTMRADLAEREARARDLERSNRELEQFAYVASHDLQEPLRKVASFSKLLKRKYDGQLDDKGHVYLDYTVDGALRMQSLVQDLLQFSRVGRTDPERRAVDLNRVMASTRSDLEGKITETAATVTHGDLPTIQADPGLMNHLFMNLVGNALKYHDPERPPRVRVDAEEHRDRWEVRVQDNGIGIAPEHQERIFVIFQRLHGRSQYEGTGIGLAICQKIVEAHGGRIGVDSVVDEGSTFHFTIPKVRP